MRARLDERVGLGDDNVALELRPLIDQQRGQQLDGARRRQAFGGVSAEQNPAVRGVHQQRTARLHFFIEQRQGLATGRGPGRRQLQKQQRAQDDAAQPAADGGARRENIPDRDDRHQDSASPNGWIMLPPVAP